MSNNSDHKNTQSNLPEDILGEAVSALMDNEASEFELRKVLKVLNGEVSKDVSKDVSKEASDEGLELEKKWQRYHLVSSSIRQEVHSNPSVNLLAGIHAGLAQDSENCAPVRQAQASRSVFRVIGQGAIAASVALLAMFSVSYLQVAQRDDNANAGYVAGASDDSSNNDALNSVLSGSMPELPALGGEYRPSELSRTVSLDAAARDRLQQAVVQFAGSKAPASFAGEPYRFPATQSNDRAQQTEK